MFSPQNRFRRSRVSLILALTSVALAGTASAAVPDPSAPETDAVAVESIEQEDPLAQYANPNHVDEDIYLDPDSGEEVVIKSGITHWVESNGEDSAAVPPTTPALFALPPAAQALSGSITPGSGTFNITTPPRLRLDINVPANAKGGESYLVGLNVPWLFQSPSGVAVQDESGTVFANVEPVVSEKQGLSTRWEVRITFTDEVESHASIRGFVDLPLMAWPNRNAKTGKITATSDGTTIASTSGTWTVPANPQQTEAATMNGGALVNDYPAVSPVIRVAYNRIPAAGWKVTLAAASAGAYPRCSATVQVESADANGWIHREVLVVEPDSCSDTTAVYTITPQIARSLGASGTVPVNLRTYFLTEKSLTSYTVKIDSNVSISGTSSWRFTAKSGEGTASGANHLSLQTSKKVTVPSESGAEVAIGDTVTYKITTKAGPGNLRPVTDVAVVDQLPAELRFVSASGGATFDSETRKVVWPARNLAIGGSFTDTLTAEVVAASPSQSVVNTVHVTGSDVCGPNDANSVCEDSATLQVSSPSFDFEKAGRVKDSNENGWVGDLGDEIVYEFKVSNTGNVILTSALLTDKALGIQDRECLSEPLQPGKKTTCAGTFSHTIGTADVGAGHFTNTGTLCVTPGSGVTCLDSTVDTPTINPSYTFTKSVVRVTDPDGKPVQTSKVSEGDKIEYQFQVKNTGNVILERIYLNDPLLGLRDVPCLANGQVLPVGKSVNCVESSNPSHVVNAADVEAGAVKNVATVNVPGLPDQQDGTNTPVLPPVVVSKLPNTGAGGSRAILLIGALAAAGGTLAVGTRWLPSQRAQYARR